MKKGSLIELHWKDSAANGAWTSEPGGLSRCQTIGYVVKATKDEIVVAQSKTEDSRWCGQMAIPRSCVTSARKLR